MAGNFQAPPRPRNALDEYKLRMSCPPTQGATKPGSLAFSLVNNQPRIDVYTNVPNDKNNGNIRAAMDADTMYAILELIRQAVKAPPEWKKTVPNQNHTFWEGKRSDQPKLISSTMVGKDKEGRVFIAVVAKDRPYLKFVFAPSLYHSIVNGDGSAMTEGEISEVYAMGKVRLLEGLYASLMNTHYQEPKPKEGGAPQGGGQRPQGGGGYQQRNNGGGGGGGYQQRSAPAPAAAGDNDGWGGDDEFPM